MRIEISMYPYNKICDTHVKQDDKLAPDKAEAEMDIGLPSNTTSSTQPTRPGGEFIEFFPRGSPPRRQVMMN